MSEIPEQLLRDEARNKWVNNLRIGDKVQYRLRNENEPRLEELKIGVPYTVKDKIYFPLGITCVLELVEVTSPNESILRAFDVGHFEPYPVGQAKRKQVISKTPNEWAMQKAQRQKGVKLVQSLLHSTLQPPSAKEHTHD